MAINRTELAVFIVLVLLVLGFAYFRTGLGGGAELLIIGQPDPATMNVLDSFRTQGYTQFNYVLKPNTSEFVRNSAQRLKPYKIIMLYQTSEDRRIPSDLAREIVNFVEKGRKLIVVKNSGIFTYNVATQDAGTLGWRATFGKDIMPVDCEPLDRSPCLQEISVGARIRIINRENKLTKGIDDVPARAEDPPLSISILPIQGLSQYTTGEELAFIETEFPGKGNFVGLASKQVGLGRTFYFNYEPGATPAIFQNVILSQVGK
jgi:hypothetical protein